MGQANGYSRVWGASQVVDVVAPVASGEQLESLVRRGLISVGLLIPPDFERRVARGERPAAQLFIDATDPTILISVRGLAELPVRRRPGPAPDAPETFEVRAWYNPERDRELLLGGNESGR